MVVPKRTVALLDRLIRALSHTLDDVEQDIGQRHNQDEHTAIKRMRGPKEISTENEYNGMLYAIRLSLFLSLSHTFLLSSCISVCKSTYLFANNELNI